jgi:hypothetical protein
MRAREDPAAVTRPPGRFDACMRVCLVYLVKEAQVGAMKQRWLKHRLRDEPVAPYEEGARLIPHLEQALECPPETEVDSYAARRRKTRGLGLYRNGRRMNIFALSSRRFEWNTYSTDGQRRYAGYIDLDESRRIVSAYCSCPDHGETSTANGVPYCKHVELAAIRARNGEVEPPREAFLHPRGYISFGGWWRPIDDVDAAREWLGDHFDRRWQMEIDGEAVKVFRGWRS